MHRHLFSQVDIAPHRAHVLDGTVPEAFAAAHAAEFDRWIEADGGLDVQLLGIGRNGHIGFNEPSRLDRRRGPAAADPPGRAAPGHPRRRGQGIRRRGSRHSASLDHGRRLDPGRAVDRDPRHGAHKAEPVARALTGPMTAELPGIAPAVGRR